MDVQVLHSEVVRLKKENEALSEHLHSVMQVDDETIAGLRADIEQLMQQLQTELSSVQQQIAETKQQASLRHVEALTFRDALTDAKVQVLKACEENSKLQLNIRDMTSQLQKNKEAYALDLKSLQLSMQDRFDKQGREHRKQLEQQTSSLQDRIKDLEDKVTKERRSFDRDLAASRLAVSETSRKTNAEVSKLESDFVKDKSRLVREHDEQIRETKERHVKEYDRQRAEYEDKLNRQRAEYEDKLNRQRTDYQDQLSRERRGYLQSLTDKDALISTSHRQLKEAHAIIAALQAYVIDPDLSLYGPVSQHPIGRNHHDANGLRRIVMEQEECKTNPDAQRQTSKDRSTKALPAPGVHMQALPAVQTGHVRAAVHVNAGDDQTSDKEPEGKQQPQQQTTPCASVNHSAAGTVQNLENQDLVSQRQRSADMEVDALPCSGNKSQLQPGTATCTDEDFVPFPVDSNMDGALHACETRAAPHAEIVDVVMCGDKVADPDQALVHRLVSDILQRVVHGAVGLMEAANIQPRTAESCRQERTRYQTPARSTVKVSSNIGTTTPAAPSCTQDHSLSTGLNNVDSVSGSPRQRKRSRSPESRSPCDKTARGNAGGSAAEQISGRSDQRSLRSPDKRPNPCNYPSPDQPQDVKTCADDQWRLEKRLRPSPDLRRSDPRPDMHASAAGNAMERSDSRSGTPLKPSADLQYLPRPALEAALRRLNPLETTAPTTCRSLEDDQMYTALLKEHIRRELVAKETLLREQARVASLMSGPLQHGRSDAGMTAATSQREIPVRNYVQQEDRYRSVVRSRDDQDSLGTRQVGPIRNNAETRHDGTASHPDRYNHRQDDRHDRHDGERYYSSGAHHEDVHDDVSEQHNAGYVAPGNIRNAFEKLMRKYYPDRASPGNATVREAMLMLFDVARTSRPHNSMELKHLAGKLVKVDRNGFEAAGRGAGIREAMYVSGFVSAQDFKGQINQLNIDCLGLQESVSNPAEGGVFVGRGSWESINSCSWKTINTMFGMMLKMGNAVQVWVTLFPPIV